MKLLTYYEAMDRLVELYEKYIHVESQIEIQKEHPEVLRQLLKEKKRLLSEIKPLSGEPLSTIKEMVEDHKSSRTNWR
ncbi:hypothetical protein [Alkalihalobacillus sp. BA299]|uniref:hypothetical protein n=1 Tax=Alkalihalobacillus sp. BA299 TaxID=2815938 RepID=UPI001AD9F2E1|nr:hypothetical protein [Alkalihalobacillus sp. BA299]